MVTSDRDFPGMGQWCRPTGSAPWSQPRCLKEITIPQVAGNWEPDSYSSVGPAI